jgi:hypothetical protein
MSRVLQYPDKATRKLQYTAFRVAVFQHERKFTHCSKTATIIRSSIFQATRFTDTTGSIVKVVLERYARRGFFCQNRAQTGIRYMDTQPQSTLLP